MPNLKILSFTCVRNEGPYLLEWIAYHRLMGVTDFVIFSNDCDDGSDRLLNALAAAGVVTHRPQQAQPGKSVQWQALTAVAQDRLTRGVDWALFSDVDEFPVVHVGQHRLADLVAALPARADAVTLPWRLFGANGRARLEDVPVTRQFTRSAPPDLTHPIAGRYFKTLYRPDAFQKPGVHRPRARPRQALPHWHDGSGQRLPDSFAAQEAQIALPGLAAGRALAEMHHYSTRSAAGFLVKADRGLANRRTKRIDLSYWVERNFNTQPNTAIASWADALDAELAALMALPGIAELHRACFAWHQARFAELVATPEGYRLFCDCLHAADSAALPRDLAMELYGIYASIRH